MRKLEIAAATILISTALVPRAHAAMIDFEDQASGPATFNIAGPAQTLDYSTPTADVGFSGGVILTGESNQFTDMTNVYATSSSGLTGADPSLGSSLVLNFSDPVQNLELDVLNALAGNYELSDNAGHVMDFSLATTGGSTQTVGFADAGTQVLLTYLSAPGAQSVWDFAVDNVRFGGQGFLSDPPGDPPGAVSVAEPFTIGLWFMGLVGLGALGQRRKLAA